MWNNLGASIYKSEYCFTWNIIAKIAFPHSSLPNEKQIAIIQCDPWRYDTEEEAFSSLNTANAITQTKKASYIKFFVKNQGI